MDNTIGMLDLTNLISERVENDLGYFYNEIEIQCSGDGEGNVLECL